MNTDTSTNTGWTDEKQLCEQPHPDSRRDQDTYSEKLELTVFPTSVFTSGGWCRDSPAPDKDLLLSFLFPAIFTTDSTCNVARAVRLRTDMFVFIVKKIIVRSRLDKLLAIALLFVYFRTFFSLRVLALTTISLCRNEQQGGAT